MEFDTTPTIKARRTVFSMSLPVSVKAQLEEDSQEMGMTQTELLRWAYQQWHDFKESQKPKPQPAPDAPATLEDLGL
jgi:hypothetical protein